jgi:ABC-2 type transport system permease protein
MSGAVFTETLKRIWRQTLYWGIGLASLGFYIVIVIPNVDTLKQYQDLIGNKMPQALMQAFGISDMAVLATPEGFIAFGFLTYALILLMVYAVLAGMNITANEEDDGTMDILLTQPVARWRVVMEKYAAYMLMSTIIVVLSYMGLVIGRLSSTLEFTMDRMLLAAIPMILAVWLVIAFTAAAATFFRRKSTAMMVVVSFIVASYFLNFIGNAASNTAAASVKFLSIFQYADAQGVIQHGLTFTSLAVLAGATAILFALSVWLFERRDVGL